MSCNCCPPVIVGNNIPPCVSTDPGNVLTQGADGCLYVPEPAPPTLDPAACNAARDDGAGLLVPRTEVTGVVGSAPAATGTTRSVDIDVVETPGCPHTWAVGARLTPASGFRNSERGHADLLAAQGTDVPIPESDVVLPEPGTYHLDTDVRYALGTDIGGSGYIIGHLRDETAGTLLTSFTQIAAINSPSAQEYQGGTTHIMAEHTVTTAPRTVRLHLMFVYTGGTIAAAAAGGSDSNGATRTRFLKVRD
ncbi:hypothetical protein KYY02_19525 [Streptomyces pimonensis]|uniref:Uncharacterized protein n=1 Tax=Streptomyces pimonensis TaxID=2860288 RepID=A0ABV4J1P8_9ACTN